MTLEQSRAARRYMVLFNRIGVIGVFASLAFLSTTFIRIPVPVSGGYFNIGDTFVMAAGLLFGPIVAAFTGLIGPTIADAIGYPQFIPATAVIKSLEGLLVGLIGYRQTGNSSGACILGLVVGGATIVLGYFVVEAYIYPYLAKSSPIFEVTNIGMAFAELMPNIFQAVISGILAFGIWRLLRGSAAP